MALRRRVNIDTGTRVTREIVEFKDKAALDAYRADLSSKLRARTIRRFSISEKDISRKFV
jgi:hypothetical protein